MTDRKAPLDSELDFRWIVTLTVGLLVVVVVAGVLMWLLAGFLYDRQAATDPPPPMLMEARMPHEPPAPRLQAEPFADLAQLRAAEERELTSYGWIDEAAGIAHIPIDRAMELMIDRGLDGPTAAAPPGDAAALIAEDDAR